MRKIIYILCIVFIGILVFLYSMIQDIDAESFTYKELDVLAIGNSNLYSAFSPKLFYKLYKKESYVMATASQSIDEAYTYLCDFLEQCPPKIVLFETDELYCSRNPKKLHENNQITLCNQKKVLEVSHTKNRGKDFDKYGFRKSRRIIPYIGFSHMIKTNQIQSISKGTYQYIQKMVTICKENKIPFVLISVPCAMDWNMEKHNAVTQVANELQIPYYDLNLSKDIQMNWLLDSRDGGIHLNNNGAIKVTKIIGQLLFGRAVK